MPPVPVQLPCSLQAEVGVAHGIRLSLEERLDHAAWQGPEALGRLFAEAPGAARVNTVVTCPDASFLLGRGLVTDLILGTTAMTEDGDDDALRGIIVRGAYADWSEGWRIHMTPPRDAFATMRVTRTEAEVWASLARRWARVDVTLHAEIDDGTLVLAAPPLEAPVTDRDAPIHSGFRLTHAHTDGARADVVLGTGGYLVIGGLADGAHTIELRYEGPLPLIGDNQAEATALALTRWLPTVPGAAPAPLALTVRHPVDETLVASLPEIAPAREARDADGTWRVAQLGGDVDRDPAIVLLDRAPEARVWDDGAGSRITLYGDGLPPFDDCTPALGSVVRALAPLGPVGDVRVVAVPTVYGRHGQRADDLVIVLRDRLTELCTRPGELRDAAMALFAHELAHGWFGREVRALDDEASSWWEGAAEYVATWALSDAAAARLRRGWQGDYADQTHVDRYAMVERMPTGGGLHEALSYAKGGLLFTALEQRVGRDHVAAILRHFIATRGGQLGSWLDLVASTQAIAGSQAAVWLHGWLTSVGAPELAVRDVRRSDGRLLVTVTVTGSAAPVELVEVALYRGDRLLGYVDAPLNGERTELELPLPEGADKLVLDPWSKLPRFGGNVEATF